jgi:energy-coupling factor transporter ATP-binding protein EcfA2
VSGGLILLLVCAVPYLTATANDPSPPTIGHVMFLLVTGASGAGKSTVRRVVAPELSPDIDCVELHHVSSVPASPTIAWRQHATEDAVQRAVELQAQRRHLLLCGDPVAAGEVIAAPSAVELDAIAVCLLDLSAEAQTNRLTKRGDDPGLLADHHAFADWMRGHAQDPRHKPHVLSAHGWEGMRWQRWTGIDPPSDSWGMDIIDTSELAPHEVAAEVVRWCRRALHREAPVMVTREERPDRDGAAAVDSG